MNINKKHEGTAFLHFHRTKLKSEIKLLGMNMQTLAQLRKIFEENIHEVGEGYFFF